MSDSPQFIAHGVTHHDKLLLHEVQPYEDPECVCEPEPRWLRFQDETSGALIVSEWESIETPPSSEL
jgi:hypothetical protein